MDFVHALVADLGLTMAVARTYAHNVRKYYERKSVTKRHTPTESEILSGQSAEIGGAMDAMIERIGHQIALKALESVEEMFASQFAVPVSKRGRPTIHRRENRDGGKQGQETVKTTPTAQAA